MSSACAGVSNSVALSQPADATPARTSTPLPASRKKKIVLASRWRAGASAQS